LSLLLLQVLLGLLKVRQSDQTDGGLLKPLVEVLAHPDESGSSVILLRILYDESAT
jgi:hypothetical protein